MSGVCQVITGFSLLWAVAFVVQRLRRNARSRGLRLPPGPKRLPVIGNLLDLPQEQPWEEYHRMSQQYGDIMYLEALGQPIVVLDSLSRATDLYDKRGATYSDRPYLPILDISPSIQHGDELEFWSDAVWYQMAPAPSSISPTRKLKCTPQVLPSLQYEEIVVLLRKLHQSPDDFLKHIQFFFGANIMRLSYGFDDVETNISLIHDAEILMQAFSEAALPGRYLVNNLPFLKYIPAWFPGAGWKRKCQYIASVNKRTLYNSFESVKESLRKGRRSAHPSMAFSLLDEMPEENTPEREELESIARISCASGYAADADTTVSSAAAFFLVLATHPDVQRKAQAEIDSVVGGSRLPLMSDRKSLPYLRAVIKELGRWYTVVPLAEDSEYEGYFIPKGTLVMANTWAILHDPEVYPDPMAFKPERFLTADGKNLDPKVQDPYFSGAFGYGRRYANPPLADRTLGI
ncbi:hypothetical protein EST38_g13581 [Candolleomyces aberdarensis]|uniref:Cytochrome P450 n=1 Tax=Candolleomyces aberdarensis TaxID=2316362 RepID=A0A4Q2CZK3_9AGAR|nr:hypothetical protein EST38_g13581 [Candolleomyces aberdarensis]